MALNDLFKRNFAGPPQGFSPYTYGQQGGEFNFYNRPTQTEVPPGPGPISSAPPAPSEGSTPSTNNLHQGDLDTSAPGAGAAPNFGDMTLDEYMQYMTGSTLQARRGTSSSFRMPTPRDRLGSILGLLANAILPGLGYYSTAANAFNTNANRNLLNEMGYPLSVGQLAGGTLGTNAYGSENISEVLNAYMNTPEGRNLMNQNYAGVQAEADRYDTQYPYKTEDVGPPLPTLPIESEVLAPPSQEQFTQGQLPPLQRLANAFEPSYSAPPVYEFNPGRYGAPIEPIAPEMAPTDYYGPIESEVLAPPSQEFPLENANLLQDYLDTFSTGIEYADSGYPAYGEGTPQEDQASYYDEYDSGYKHGGLIRHFEHGGAVSEEEDLEDLEERTEKGLTAKPGLNQLLDYWTPKIGEFSVLAPYRAKAYREAEKKRASGKNLTKDDLYYLNNYMEFGGKIIHNPSAAMREDLYYKRYQSTPEQDAWKYFDATRKMPRMSRFDRELDDDPTLYNDELEAEEIGREFYGYPPEGMAEGGLLNGPGSGKDDLIPATINGQEEARLSDGEFVLPADVVSKLGDGSTKAGASQLYKLIEMIRQKDAQTSGLASLTRQYQQPQRPIPSNFMPSRMPMLPKERSAENPFLKTFLAMYRSRN